MPEQWLKKIKERIAPQWCVCFLSALVVGFVSHLYKLSNWLPNWDSLVFRYDAQNMLKIGRWFLPIVSAPSSYYDLPLLTGLIALVLFALGAVCICCMFDVKKPLTAVLIGAVVISFPNVTSVLLYNYVADAYAFSFLLACAAALLLTREKPHVWMAAVLIALSVGIYQAYLTVTIMLLLCYLIKAVLCADVTIKTVFSKIGAFLLSGVVGMVLYYVVLTVLLKITGTTLLDYQGMDSAASLAGINLLTSLYIVKDTFVTYFFDFSNGFNVFGMVNIAVFVLMVAVYLAEIIKNKLPFLKIALMCVLVALLPIGACALSFINCYVDYHNLMKMGYVVFYLLLILQYEKADFKSLKTNVAKQWAILAVMAVLVCNQMVIANVSYHKLQMAYEKSYGTLIRIADRIEQTEGAERCHRILVVGELPGSEAYSAVLPPDITGTTDGFILRADDEVVGQSVLCSALNDYCGMAYTFVAGKERETLLAKADGLHSWPHADAVCVIEDVIVIKLG